MHLKSGLIGQVASIEGDNVLIFYYFSAFEILLHKIGVLRYKGQIDVYYVFNTEPYHVLWYKGQIDVYYVFSTEPYHV